VSTDDGSSDGPSTTTPAVRDIRDRPLFRIAAVLAVLAVAFGVAKGCSRQQNEVSQDEAIAIAKKQVDFTPEKVQVRYLPQGIPPVYYWAVSLYTLTDGNPARVEVVLVNATTGAVRKT
jgi:Peptidase propeptide and YPEB domain